MKGFGCDEAQITKCQEGSSEAIHLKFTLMCYLGYSGVSKFKLCLRRKLCHEVMQTLGGQTVAVSICSALLWNVVCSIRFSIFCNLRDLNCWVQYNTRTFAKWQRLLCCMLSIPVPIAEIAKLNFTDSHNNFLWLWKLSFCHKNQLICSISLKYPPKWSLCCHHHEEKQTVRIWPNQAYVQLLMQLWTDLRWPFLPRNPCTPNPFLIHYMGAEWWWFGWGPVSVCRKLVGW